MNLKQALLRSVQRSDNKIKTRTDGLNHVDSMQQLDFPVNCMNWNLGHILVYRMEYLSWIDERYKPDAAEMAMYGAGSEPLIDSEAAMPMETIMARLAEVSGWITAALEAMPEERLDELFDAESGTTLGDRLEFYLIYHETTHIGMLEILQELAHARR